MILKLPTPAQLQTAYLRDLTDSFPPAELKPLQAIEDHLAEGRYRPWCLFDGGEIAGECFLWLGNPGWALLDYLCISPRRRNGGLGSLLLEKMRLAEPQTVVFAETEDPECAPDPEMARRRIGFYRRSGARFASFQSEIFGVRYQLIYWAERELPDSVLMEQYDAVYRRSFPPEKYQKYIRIPRHPGSPSGPQVPWDESRERDVTIHEDSGI